MLTIFAIPKAFEGHFGTIQRNAIGSWLQLEPRPKVILLGSDAGTREICDELGLLHVPEVTTTDTGAPRLDSVFAQGQRHATSDVMAYVNADIVLLPGFTRAVDAVKAECDRFLLIGRRWDVDVPYLLDFSDSGWAVGLKEALSRDTTVVNPYSVDYFVFSRGVYNDVLPLALGRGLSDNWLVWKAAEQGAVIVDGTARIPIVHQRHDYSHVDGGQATVFRGPDADYNARFSFDVGHHRGIMHADLLLQDDGTLVPAPKRRYWAAQSRYYRSRAWIRFCDATRPLRHSTRGQTLNRVLRRRMLPGAESPGVHGPES